MSALQGLKEISSQLIDLLKTIAPADYQSKLEVFEGSTIGQHVRHIVNFMQRVTQGVDSGVIDYAARDRDVRLETDPSFAYHALLTCLEKSNQLNLHQTISFRGDFMHTPETDRPIYPSSIGRELTFVHDHAVHHMALIKIGLRIQCPGMLSNAHFGVAPSTIKYRHTQQA